MQLPRVLVATGVMASFVLCGVMGVRGQVPADQLAKAPKEARAFTIFSTSGVNGHSYVWTAPDGAQMSRESILLRGQVWEIDQEVRLGADHMPRLWVVRGVNPNGDAAESFRIEGQQASWKSPVDKGEAKYAAPAFYYAMGGTSSGGTAVFIETLLASPGRTMATLPGGRAQAEKLTEATVGKGATERKVTAWAVTGLGPSPVPIWTTAEGKFFGTVGGLACLPAGYEDALKTLQQAQDEARAARSPVVARQLLKDGSSAIAFVHVRAFVDGIRFVDDQTVVVEGGKITAVGSATTTKVPAGAKVIDGKGKTLTPGLWDAHQHILDDSAGPFLLALGITSVRDPGNDNDLTLARAKRRAAGELLMPHVYPSVLIDGKGPNAAQLGVVVGSQEELLAAVRKAKAEGFL